jgi:hypothetical protein
MVKYNFPKAEEWMWDYCIYLGPYELKGVKYDLGVYVDPDGLVSAAIVYGNKGGEYFSGHLFYDGEMYNTTDPKYIETTKRAKAVGII